MCQKDVALARYISDLDESSRRMTEWHSKLVMVADSRSAKLAQLRKERSAIAKALSDKDDEIANMVGALRVMECRKDDVSKLISRRQEASANLGKRLAGGVCTTIRDFKERPRFANGTTLYCVAGKTLRQVKVLDHAFAAGSDLVYFVTFRFNMCADQWVPECDLVNIEAETATSDCPVPSKRPKLTQKLLK